jgi:tetratricopeptide (TPR) repeat protein
VFLLIHAAAFAIAFVLMDRKLGYARDWDILTPQIGGVVLLAALLWQEESELREDPGILPPLRTAAPWVALLLVWPWLAVNASRGASLERFADIKGDFPAFPRAYATEELAKYYRDHGDLHRALPLYEECVRIYPRNPRTRILLGSSYYDLDQVDEAIAQFDEALKLDPKSWLALDARSRIALKRKDYATAYDISRRETEIRSNDPDAWGTLGYAALQLGHYAESNNAFEKAAGLRVDPKLYYYAGLTSAYLERWDEAVDDLSRALGAGTTDPVIIYAAAAAIEGRIAARAGPPHGNDPKQLALARDLAMRSASAAPAESTYASYLRHLDRVLAGSEKAANWLRP